MGKQSKRKTKKGKGNQNQQQQEGDTKGSTLLQRLRHADPKTRHAALAALATTVLDPESLGKKRKVQLNLLQAIRERVMDDDLECAQAAAGCLANYISFGQQQDQLDVTASWTVVLVERLKVCAEKLKDQPNKKQWWALTMQCLHALCSLIETNPQALDLLTDNNSIRTLLDLLEHGTRELEQSKSGDSAAPPQDLSLQKNVTIYAVRTLHSALDDNPELLNQWMESDQASWGLIQASCKNQALPVACRLHCTGCLVTARLLSGDEALQSAVISEALPLLHSFLDVNLDSSLVQTYMDCHEKWKEEEADDALEKAAIQTVKERNEPSRSIARRQKANKAEKKKSEQAMKEDAKEEDGMKEEEDDAKEEDEDDTKDEDDDGMEEDGKPAAPERENAREALEKARDSWHEAITPLELALEITANLTSLSPTLPEMADMDMDGDWGPDQEAMMMAQQQEMEEGTLSPLDAALAQAIVTAQIPNRLVALLKMICKPLPNGILPEIKEEIEGLQSKCGAGLGNCAGEHFPNWTNGLLQELRGALEASNGNPSIANAMAAALRSRSELRKQCQPSDLELLFKLSSSSPCQKEAVEMLGILCCMESHPEDVNRKVCSALMAITSKKAAVLNEVLNALMDIYGDDDCHPGVFVSLNVLGYFQRTTPSFKKVTQYDRDEATEEEMEQWKETAFNASRFVSYKKGQL
jgi:hypothetical protein